MYQQTLSVREKINSGAYRPRMSFPESGDPDYKEKRSAYRREEERLRQVMKADLFQEYDVAQHPKAQRAWEMAWDRGHSSGLLSVLDEWDDLVDLIK